MQSDNILSKAQLNYEKILCSVVNHLLISYLISCLWELSIGFSPRQDDISLPQEALGFQLSHTTYENRPLAHSKCCCEPNPASSPRSSSLWVPLLRRNWPVFLSNCPLSLTPSTIIPVWLSTPTSASQCLIFICYSSSSIQLHHCLVFVFVLEGTTWQCVLSIIVCCLCGLMPLFLWSCVISVRICF